MENRISFKNKLICALSVAGLLFSGYLSATKLFTNTCAFGESCPYFLGYPACIFGFAMYFILTDLSVLCVLKKTSFHTRRQLMSIIATVSFLGILFAGYFTFSEFPRLFSEGVRAYMLGLPTCAYGLVVFLTIFGLAVSLLYKGGAQNEIVQ